MVVGCSFIFAQWLHLNLLLFQPGIVTSATAGLLLSKQPSCSGRSLAGILFPQTLALPLPLMVALTKSLLFCLQIKLEDSKAGMKTC